MSLPAGATLADLARVLDEHKLTMTATATGDLWTVMLDNRWPPHDHHIGSGSSLHEALVRALEKVTRRSDITARIVRAGKK